mgnify:CR=1 FL=1
MTKHLLDALEAHRGVICAIGAGGKKTTLYRVAEAHAGRVGISTTVFMAPFPRTLDAVQVIRPADELHEAVPTAAREHHKVAFACPSEKKARMGGLPIDLIRPLHDAAGFDLTLVKSDGARMRGIKAPAADEPNLAAGVDTVLYLVSANVLGAPLDETVAHRVEQLEAVTGARRGEPLSPVHVARLLTSPDGAGRGVGRARLIPIINQVDDDERLELAREAARRALALGGGFDRVVLASMQRTDPVVEIVH